MARCQHDVISTIGVAPVGSMSRYPVPPTVGRRAAANCRSTNAAPPLADAEWGRFQIVRSLAPVVHLNGKSAKS